MKDSRDQLINKPTFNVNRIYSDDGKFGAPNSISDLGLTQIPAKNAFSASYNAEQNSIEVRINIQVTYSSLINTDEFKTINLGRKQHIIIHEEQHVNQYKEEFSASTTIDFKGNTYTGTINEIATQYFVQGFAKAQAISKNQEDFNIRMKPVHSEVGALMDNVFNQLIEQFNAKYQGNKIEIDAIQRTTQVYKEMGEQEPAITAAIIVAGQNLNLA